MTDKLKSYIGLAQRAGCVLYGEDIICEKKNRRKSFSYPPMRAISIRKGC